VEYSVHIDILPFVPRAVDFLGFLGGGETKDLRTMHEMSQFESTSSSLFFSHLIIEECV
jgi:hypothetical protein